MYLTTRGLVLRTTEYKETDRILTVLTAEDGLLTLKARGVRSNRSKLKGACQLLTYAEFTVGEAHGFSFISEATAIEMFAGLRNDIVLLALSSYFAQLAEVLSQEDAASPALLSLILNALYALSKLQKPPRLGDRASSGSHRRVSAGAVRLLCVRQPGAGPVLHCGRYAGVCRLPLGRRRKDAALAGVSGGYAVYPLVSGEEAVFVFYLRRGRKGAV